MLVGGVLRRICSRWDGAAAAADKTPSRYNIRTPSLVYNGG
jgi:hypothetical protein